MNQLSMFLAILTFFTGTLSSPIVQFQPDSKAEGDGVALNTTNDNSTDSYTQSNNPFLRSKRAVTSCAVPPNWPAMITELNSFLNATTVMSLSPQQTSLPALPTNQPTSCPATNTWWPGSTDNLKSTCPWIYNDTDLGESFYPRYIREAVCLCPYCVTANAMGCQKLRQEITVLKRVTCKDGLAVMNTMKRTITVGCYCTGVQVQQPTTGVVGPTPTD